LLDLDTFSSHLAPMRTSIGLPAAALWGACLRYRSITRHSLLLAAILLGAAPLAEAQHRVRGTVTAADDGLPLAGVNILVVGTTTGTATGANGTYDLVVPSETATLRFSFIGYETQHVPVDGREVIDVVLAIDPILGDEVVVVGYGVQRRRDVTGAISRVEGEDIARVPVMNVEQALQGRVAGVQVIPASGEPGAGAVVRIRGIGTLNNAAPLYVVDGMLLDDISFLNPNDVESVDVLKDASATAIYGSRGANGVIIITTRRATIDRPIISIGSYTGFEGIANRIDVVTAQEYAVLANELAANEGLAPFFEDPSAFGQGTDWQGEVFQTAPLQNHQLSASGMTESISYFVSGNYARQGGVIPRSEFTRATVRINNDYRLSSFVSLGHNLSLAYTDSRAAPPVATSAYLSDPTIAPLNEEGYFSDLSDRGMGNPLATIEYTQNYHRGTRIVGNAFLDVDFLRHFTFRSNLGVDVSRNEGRTFLPVFFVSPIQQSPQSSINVFNAFANTWLWENTVTFRRIFGRHSLNVLGGVTMQEFTFENLGGSRVNVIGDSRHLWYLNAGDAEGQTNFNAASSWGMLSYLARANYSYLERYLLTASLRVDGSSRFGSDNRFGVFPSVALGWMISEEPFMRDLATISSLKLRGSYGVIGNDKIGAYPGRPVVTGNLNAPFGLDPSLHFGASLVDMANPDVAWESTSQFNVGVDVSILDHRLSADVDYYSRTTNDILVQVPIPGYVGVNAEPFVNAARVRNNGFDFSLRYRDQVGDFSYRIATVASTVNNTVLSLGQGREEILGGPVGEGGKLATRTIVGQPIGSFYGYRVVGVFQNEEELQRYPRRGPERPGDLRFEDITGDGVITTDDRTFLGSPYPDYVFGFSLGAGYRGLDLDVDFNGQYGNLIYNAKRAARFGIYNFETTFLDRWHGEGTSDFEPRITNAGHNYEVSDRFLEDGSFLKLRNVRLTYTLPARMTTGLNLSNARVYVNGSNLMTFTRYTGYSPEIMGFSVLDAGVDRGIYPPNRSFTIGFDLTF
jgi:TonB-linked SusC/RagA family outer membrane protein